MWVLGHSLIFSLVRSHRSLTQTLPSTWESEWLMSQNDLVLSHSGALLDRYRGLLANVRKYRKLNPRPWATAIFRLHVYERELGCPLDNVVFDEGRWAAEARWQWQWIRRRRLIIVLTSIPSFPLAHEHLIPFLGILHVIDRLDRIEDSDDAVLEQWRRWTLLFALLFAVAAMNTYIFKMTSLIRTE